MDALVDELAPQVAAGALVLFTGAGFSEDARARSGRPLPSTRELIDLLWPLAFDDEPVDRSELGDVYACAVRAAPERTGEVLSEHLCVDERTVPETYATWLSMPWFRTYTLNVDDLEEAVARRFPLPVSLHPVSALRDELPARCADLFCVHLNGRIADYPDLTFSHQQYGRRTALQDPWYQHLAADLSTHPVLFVGTTLNEPPLWQQFALRVDLLRRLGSARPRSYLVSPRLPLARQRVLHDLDVEWIRMEQAEFAETVLSRLAGAAAEGHRALSAPDPSAC